MSPFSFLENRRQQQEINRRIQVKEGRRKAERHVRNQKTMLRRYWEMATKAYRLADKQMVVKIATMISATRGHQSLGAAYALFRYDRGAA
ncbi:MAG: hypothetical protein IPO15_00045 [Anaerolineae bacterium]|uniref:hypothetical protein n=1 Tax=Candidatus Amarolinea dominans TaxID=3140696 RepID=UPI003134C42E|nr:hypothetical protein [Anaerolineae bacterium]